MKRYRVRSGQDCERSTDSLKMDHPAALHRVKVGVPATVEHSAEAAEGGAETGKWVAETTQVRALDLARRIVN